MMILQLRSKTESRFFFAWGGAILKISFAIFLAFWHCFASLTYIDTFVYIGALLRFASFLRFLPSFASFLPLLPSFASHCFAMNLNFVR
jgi:hypothetical protein